MSVSCECCVFSGRNLCNRLITRPEESYRLWYIVECNLETLRKRKPWSTGGCCAKKENINTNICPNVQENISFNLLRNS